MPKRDVETLAHAEARLEAECEDFIRSTATVSAAALRLGDALHHLGYAIKRAAHEFVGVGAKEMGRKRRQKGPAAGASTRRLKGS